jgi:hypothetical protein
MFRGRTTHLVSMVILAVLAIAAGSAFTAANAFDAHAGNQLGYGTQNVSGVHVTSMHDTLHANGVTVDTVTFVALGDLTHGVPVEHGFVGFTVAGVPGPTVDCGTGVYDGTTATTFTCDVTGLAQQVATIQATDIDVSN